MKKKGYYEYENGIYPLKLWVHIGKDLKELIDSCFDKCKAPDIDYGGEPSAYLIGWIASCINKARLGIGDFVELKDKEE